MKAIKPRPGLFQKCCAVFCWKYLAKMLQNRNRSIGNVANNEDIVKAGYLKKLKTMKKKYFVLRRETGPDSPARLEYYDNERKFRAGAQPKKPIILRTCFSINRKKDPKHSHVIALYSNNDSVCIAGESDAEMSDWLGLLHHHMHETGADGQSRKMYEHVWLVVVQPRSLGSKKGLMGEHHICLTYKSIALVRVGDCQKKIEFPLNSIRRCGHTGSFFFLGLGRSAVTGAGDIWMLTEDAVIAENMHSIIRKAMHDPLNNMSEDAQTRERTHSVSNHRSFDGVPQHTLQEWQRPQSTNATSNNSHTSLFSRPGNISSISSGPCHMRGRCDSMPSRSRTSSEGSVQNVPNKFHGHNCSHQTDGSMASSLCLHVTRPKSMYSSSLSSSCSPPFFSALFSPSSSESMESATSVDDFEGLHSNTPDNIDGLCGSEEDSYMDMGRIGSTETSISHQHRELPQPPFSLPIISTRPMGSSQNKVAGVISPVSGSSIDGHCLSSPQDNYLEMASPSECINAGLVGSHPERAGYMFMDKTQAQPQGSSASENCGYMSMGPLNSPGSIPTAWPSHSSSQVSSPPHSASHSRIPSVVDDTTDSYLSMLPGGHLGDITAGEHFGHDRSEGYLDMTPTPAVPTPIPYSPSDGDSFPEMSPGSSCSFTSGTPSSDHRFPDFIAEKSGSGSYYGYSEDDDSSIDRPIRTNSVGSKPEQFRSRKNRLEVSPAEPARVRAFSVGSRVSLRLAGGRAGQVAGGAIAATSVSVAEFSSSIKERGKQVKSKSTSAPILGSSPISNSWSGTPGTFFRGFLQARSQERNNDLMEFDFSKNKSCDSISADKEKKSSSFESIKRTLTGQRHRSNSKSSGNGKSSVFDSIKRDKKKSESELSAKSIELSERGNYCELEINPSPHRKTSDSYDGYLPMKPAINTSQPLCSSEYLDMNSRDSLIRQTSFADPYVDMSRGSDRYGSSCSSGSHDGYVDMSQGKGLGPLPLTSISSSSTTSNSSSSIGARVRKISSTLNPLSSQDSTSQLDEYMPVDFRSNTDSSSHSLDGEKHKKKEKKSSKRKSFKESTKRKKSEPINVVVKSGDSEGLHEVSKKGTSPLSSLSTLLGRKNSGTTPKTPLSPTGSPLPKSNRGTPSPFSSLTRSKNRDDKDGRKDSVVKDSSGGMSSSINSGIGTSCIEESNIEVEESAIPVDNLSVTASSQTVPNSGEQQSKQTLSVNDCSKRILGICEAASQADTKQEESQGSVGLESLCKGSTSQQLTNICSSDQGAYVNLALGTCDKILAESRQRKVSNTSLSDYMNVSPIGSSKVSEGDTHKPHDYVNMCPGGRSESVTTSLTPPQLPPTLNMMPPSSKTNAPGNSDASDKSSLNIGKGISRQHSRKDSERSSIFSSGGESEGGGGGESGYLLMTPGQPPPKPSSPRMVAHRPDIPPALLGGRPDPSLTATLERLNFVSSVGNSSSERCRSHSGPGAPEGSAVSSEVRVKKQLSEPRSGSGCQGNNGRAASACSSPVSYSPPTSPTLGGSVSSVSSLSEGGLSSASSTCTVVNVGVGRREGGSCGTSRVLDTPADLAAHSTVPLVTSQQASALIGSGSADSGLNYVSLDLGPAKCESVRPSPRTGRRALSGTVTQGACTQKPVVGEEDEPLSYAQIDFTKSEGLRTTSLSCDHRH